MTLEDLGHFYEVYPNGGEVPLWCEGVSEIGNSDGCSTGKRSKDVDSSKCCQQETEVESVYIQGAKETQRSMGYASTKALGSVYCIWNDDNYDNPLNHLLFLVQLLGKNPLVRQLVEQV